MSFASIGPIAIHLPETVETNERLRREFRTAMFLLGSGTVAQLEGNEGLLAGPLPVEW